MVVLFIILFVLILWSACKIADESKKEKELWEEYMDLHKDYKR